MKRVPDVTFRTRVKESLPTGEYVWQNVNTAELFADKRVVLFSLPGAFTPTCSTYQLPGYEENYERLLEAGVDDVYCISVNDAFVMNAWGKSLGIEKVKLLPDGNADFTHCIGQAVEKTNLGFGVRSWRYAAVINDGVIEQLFEEPGKVGNCFDDPYEVSDPETVLNYLQSYAKKNA
jgi:peroxiredoxin